MMLIETERLDLRQWSEKDKPAFHKINSDPEVRKYFPDVPTRDQSDAFIDQAMKEIEAKKYDFFAAEIRDTEQFIGSIGLREVTLDTPFSSALEIAWRLDPAFWRKGYATEGAKALLSFAFGYLKKEEVVSFISPLNIASIGVMEKLGMTRDEQGDFDHPEVPEGHKLKKHVLYRIRKEQFRA